MKTSLNANAIVRCTPNTFVNIFSSVLFETELSFRRAENFSYFFVIVRLEKWRQASFLVVRLCRTRGEELSLYIFIDNDKYIYIFFLNIWFLYMIPNYSVLHTSSLFPLFIFLNIVCWNNALYEWNINAFHPFFLYS